MDLIQEIEKQPLFIDQLVIYFIGQSGYVLKTKDCTLYIEPYLSDYIENPKGLNDSYMNRNYPTPFFLNKSNHATELFVPILTFIIWILGL